MHAYLYIILFFTSKKKIDHAGMKMLNLKTVKLVVEVLMPPLKEGVETLVTHHPSQVLNQMIALIQTKPTIVILVDSVIVPVHVLILCVFALHGLSSLLLL